MSVDLFSCGCKGTTHDPMCAHAKVIAVPPTYLPHDPPGWACGCPSCAAEHGESYRISNARQSIDRGIETTKAALDAWRRAEADADRLAHSLRWLLDTTKNKPDSLDRRAALKALEMHDEARR